MPSFEDPDLDDELAKQLAQGMEQLMSGMSEHPELKTQMEALVKTMEKDLPGLAGAGVGAGDKGKGAASASAPAKTGDAFQDKIQEALNNLRNSQDKVGVSF